MEVFFWNHAREVHLIIIEEIIVSNLRVQSSKEKNDLITTYIGKEGNCRNTNRKPCRTERYKAQSISLEPFKHQVVTFLLKGACDQDSSEGKLIPLAWSDPILGKRSTVRQGTVDLENKCLTLPEHVLTPVVRTTLNLFDVRSKREDFPSKLCCIAPSKSSKRPRQWQCLSSSSNRRDYIVPRQFIYDQSNITYRRSIFSNNYDVLLLLVSVNK